LRSGKSPSTICPKPRPINAPSTSRGEKIPARSSGAVTRRGENEAQQKQRRNRGEGDISRENRLRELVTGTDAERIKPDDQAYRTADGH
jgi:hypothetical protein